MRSRHKCAERGRLSFSFYRSLPILAVRAPCSLLDSTALALTFVRHGVGGGAPQRPQPGLLEGGAPPLARGQGRIARLPLQVVVALARRRPARVVQVVRPALHTPVRKSASSHAGECCPSRDDTCYSLMVHQTSALQWCQRAPILPATRWWQPRRSPPPHLGFLAAACVAVVLRWAGQLEAAHDAGAVGVIVRGEAEEGARGELVRIRRLLLHQRPATHKGMKT